MCMHACAYTYMHMYCIVFICIFLVESYKNFVLSLYHPVFIKSSTFSFV